MGNLWGTVIRILSGKPVNPLTENGLMDGNQPQAPGQPEAINLNLDVWQMCRMADDAFQGGHNP